MAVKAAVLGGKAGDVALDAAVFEAEVKPHLVHETVRSELNAARSGTRGAKSRGLVSGGRAKPWRQKGTGRARQGTIRAPGSIGASATPSRVFKGMKMAGRMGGKRRTQVGLVVHAIDADRNLLLVKGSVPGPKSGLLEIREEKAHAGR